MIARPVRRSPTACRPLRPFLVAVATLAAGLTQAHATDLKVVSGAAMARVLTDLAPRIEELTDRHLVIDVVAPAALTSRLTRGDRFDVAIVYEPAAIELLENGRALDGQLFCIGWTRLGLAAAPRADLLPIGNVSELKQTALAARSIGYNAGDPSGVQFRTALAQLGILHKIEGKLIDLGAESSLDAIRRGTVELGVAYVGEIASTAGVRSLGALPWQVQQLTPIFAGVSRDTTEREAAQRLIAYLSSFDGMAALTAHDLDGTPTE